MKRLRSLLLAISVFAIATGSALSALPAAAVSSSSLSIQPTKNYTIKAGKSINDKLTIRNLSDTTDLDLTLRVIDFTYTGDGGTPKLMLNQDSEPTTWSLRPYMSVPEHVVIPKDGTKSIKLKISVPAGHGAGSLYSAILYSSGSAQGDNVGLSASGTTLVFVDIPGKVHEDLKLDKLGAYHDARAGTNAGYTFLTMSKPSQLAYTLKNSGNVTESPAGAIVMTDMFGRQHKIDNINPSNVRALIGQTRTFTTCINLQKKDVEFQGSNSSANKCATPSLWPGRYTVSLDAYYGQNGNKTQEVIGHASFWYLPLWFILLSIFVLLILAFGIWRLKVRISGPQQRSHRRSVTGRRK